MIGWLAGALVRTQDSLGQGGSLRYPREVLQEVKELARARWQSRLSRAKVAQSAQS